MRYGVKRQADLTWVATIAGDNPAVNVDVSQPFAERVDARNLRDLARAKGVASFAELEPAMPEPAAIFVGDPVVEPAPVPAEPVKPKRKWAPAKPKADKPVAAKRK